MSANLLLLFRQNRSKINWNFAVDQATGEALLKAANLTHSRASNATMFDATGKLVWAPVNLFLSSVPGSFTYSNATKDLNAIENPVNGAATATKVYDNDTSGKHEIAVYNMNVIAGRNHTTSIYLKKGTETAVRIGLSSSQFGAVGVTVNLSTGAIDASSGVVGTPAVQSVGNEWYRVSFVALCTTTATNAAAYVSFANNTPTSTSSPSYSGVGHYFYFFGIQCEPTSYDSPHPYHEAVNNGYYGPRFDYDPVTLVAKGLLIEENKTNYAKPHIPGDTWDNKTNVVFVDAVEAPSGIVEAATISDGATAGVLHYCGSQSLSLVSGITYTSSVYVKAGTATVVQLTFPATSFSTLPYANFNLATGAVSKTSNVSGSGIESVGGGWYRIWISAPASSTTPTTQCLIGFTGNNNPDASRLPAFTGAGRTLNAWGAQVESVTSPSSLIPTFAASTIRAADQVTFAIPNGVTRLRYTFDDDSTQEVTGLSAGAYTVPTNLNRAWIKRITSY